MPLSRDEVIRILVAQGAMQVDPDGPFLFTDDQGNPAFARQVRPINTADLDALIQANGGTAEGLPLYAEVVKDGRHLTPQDEDYYILALRGPVANTTVIGLDFQGADLQGARLGGANLDGANLQGARLGSANLQGARLGSANLQGAGLGVANLQGAFLLDANLQGAFLLDANLQGARLWDANLQGARLGSANLQEADLRSANLQEADLRSANLQEADLRSANLQGADLRSANLQGADLWDAKLQGADLWDAKLQGAALAGARWDSATRWEGARWGDYVLGDERLGYYKEAAETYRRLKTEHRERGIYDVEAKFHYREWVCRRKDAWRKKSYVEALGLILIESVMGYGVRYERVVLTSLNIFLAFALFYYLFGLFPNRGIYAFLQSLYFSAVSFTALGYGGWVSGDLGWPKYLGATEAILGVFIMTLALAVVTRRWTR